MDSLNGKFGKSLREIRKKNGWTQEQLAKKLNTTKQVISKYENSQRSPNIYIAREYADVLGVSLAEMLGQEVTAEETAEIVSVATKATVPITSEARILSAGVDRMPEEERKKLLQMVELMFDQYFKGDDDNG